MFKTPLTIARTIPTGGIMNNVGKNNGFKNLKALNVSARPPMIFPPNLLSEDKTSEAIKL